MKNQTIVAAMAIVLLALTGCATGSNSGRVEFYDFEKLGAYQFDPSSTLAIVSVSDKFESIQYVDEVISFFNDQGYSVPLKDDIAAVFPSYPTKIFANIYLKNMVPREEVDRLKMIAERMDVDFVLGLSVQEFFSSTTYNGARTDNYSWVFESYLYDRASDSIVGQSLTEDSYRSNLLKEIAHPNTDESDAAFEKSISELYEGILSQSN